ncbi:alpha/beta fold hydrolase [Streptomyces tsukubensis]|uniref:Alpha/beta hydrolase n=1 Tax=Streptomyces tsukubensis TaxID=83656 RepID=A0A1V4AAC1_9ACTN|nr:alpha/beta hydrolase [Streptomyces tsukubensis]OON80023.1 alpha/beta hydrolase [Streptomyces tsukubensis]QFR97253.1 alpha/beta fold hydrolase [Streptomyces tsukubensis]
MPSMTTDDGVRLHYLDEGGDGPPVVLVAGFKAPATSWKYQQPVLAAAGHRVLSLDRRSHGGSDDPEHGHTMARHGEDLDQFLAALDIRDAVLVGGSMGASTIWSRVASFGTGRIRGVVTVDQTPRMLASADWPHGFYGYTEENRDTYFADGVPQTGRGTSPLRRPDVVPRLVSALGLSLKDGLKRPPLSPRALALLHDHAVSDWREVVDRIDVPALLVAARDSELWPCEHAAAAAEHNPLVGSVVLEKCGHAANIERPAEFNRVLLDFLTGLGDTRSGARPLG